MFIDYQKAVLQDYRKKKDSNTISQRLVHPTPANLKEACIAVCQERYDRKDELLLRDFFGKQDAPSAYLQAIKKYDTDKFKALLNFLNEKVKNPDPKNVELLAWLIDFEPRPFKLGRRYDDLNMEQESIKEANGDPGEQEVQVQDGEEEEKAQEESEASRKNKDEDSISALTDTRQKTKFILIKQPAIMLTGVFILVGAISYLVFRPTGSERCMYWVGDHYEQVSCNHTFQNTLVIAYDSIKLTTFKRITRTDTITENSKGKVWYSKIDNNIEFFTSGGFHPVYIHRRLKPITEYIVNKYVSCKN